MPGPEKRASSTRWFPSAGLLVGLVAAGLLGGACNQEADERTEDPGTSSACLPTRAYFAQNVWAPVMSKICIKCHAPDGVATEQNAKLLLYPSSYPGFLDANLASLTQLAKIEYEGTSTLLLKPLGELEHGGGVQLDASSPEYQALSELVERLRSGGSCPEGTQPAAFDDVVLLDALGTLRKASLALVGRLPNQQEIEAVLERGEDALGPTLDGMLKEPAFTDRLQEIMNDLLLTDRYLGYSSYALNLLNKDDWPNAGEAWFDTLTDAEKAKVNRAVAREPLELITHVVKNERPFSEVLTADYTLLNPLSAKVYNATVGFSNPSDDSELQEAKIVALRSTGPVTLPHAGILSSPMFLNRFPTTPTNRNRHRARMVLQMFLATDILKIAERPIDPTQATNYANPTREDSACNVCHRQIDPIAGAFQKWDDNDQERYRPDRQWHQEMFPPGYGKEQMQVSDYEDALGWLAERVVKDPRFALSAVFTVFRALTGQEPLDYPADGDGPLFPHQLAAWEAQDATFRAIAEAFLADGQNLKTVFKQVILSPYFRAKNAKAPLSPERATELAGMGTGRLVIPEVLARKVRAVTGLQWARGSSYGKVDYLTSDYRILYGGIDSDDVTARLTQPNGVMANVAWRMANEVACQTTAWELSRPAAERKLLPYVSIEDAPEDEEGAASPEAIADIKKNLRYLHAHVLGEALEPGDPELERSYRLFFETWKEGGDKIASAEIGSSIPYACRARKNPFTDQDLPAEERLEQDPRYVVRAWMAVLTYLLADFGFLYE
jgi:hypothetical protein